MNTTILERKEHLFKKGQKPWNYNPSAKVCELCHSVFLVPSCRSSKAQFCSIKCKTEYQIGRENTSKTKFVKGQKPWITGIKGLQPWMNTSGLNNKGDTPWNKGKTNIWTDEQLEKMSIERTGRVDSIATRLKKSVSMQGKNSKGGVTTENLRVRGGIEIRLWREAVFARDNYTCQKCQTRGNYIEAHHIQNFSSVKELRTSISNGITFCKPCHETFHKIYGRFNNNYEQVVEFSGDNSHFMV